MENESIKKIEGETRAVEIDGQVNQIPVYEKTILVRKVIDVEQLKLERDSLVKRIQEIDLDISEIYKNESEANVSASAKLSPEENLNSTITTKEKADEI